MDENTLFEYFTCENKSCRLRADYFLLKKKW